MPSPWYDRARELTLELVSRPSVTGTPEEKAFALHLRDLLATWPHFTAHPEDLWLIRPATGAPS
jgi:arginine utilization protein RocB